MTALLKGQAVYVALGSRSVTSKARSLSSNARAQLAPPKPPPTTTTRGAALPAARATGKPNAASTPPAATPRNTARRLLLVGTLYITATFCWHAHTTATFSWHAHTIARWRRSLHPKNPWRCDPSRSPVEYRSDTPATPSRSAEQGTLQARAPDRHPPWPDDTTGRMQRRVVNHPAPMPAQR